MNRLGAKFKEAKASFRSRSKSRPEPSTPDTGHGKPVPTQENGSAPVPPEELETPTASTESTSAVSKAVDGSSALSNKLWNEALESLSDDQRRVLLGTSKPDSKLDLLQNMLDATEQREIECNSRKWKIKVGSGREIVVADKAAKIVQWLNKFKAIGDLAVNYDPVHAALPWAGVKFLLEAAVADTEAKAALLVALERMVYLIGRCTIYEKLYINEEKAQSLYSVEKQLEATLTKLYIAILRFLCTALGFYHKNAFSRTYDALLNQGELQEFLSDLEYSEERVHRDAENCGSAQNATAHKELLENGQHLRDVLDSWKDPIMHTASSLANIEDGLSQEKRQKILTWISRIEYARLHHTARENRVEGTGRWILDHQQYLEWKRSNESMILWLHGVPGAGKTKLASRVVDDFLSKHESQSYANHALAYFYCDRNQSELRNDEIIMNSIFRQLAAVGEGSILSPVLELHENKRKTAFASGSPLFAETVSVLPDVLSKYQQVTVIVDALDECEPKARKNLITKFHSLIDGLKGSFPTVFRVFLSSRRDQDIADAFKDMPKLAVEATDNREDIAKFISDGIDPLPIKSDLKEEIGRTLQDKSEGVFQWVALQLYRVQELSPIEKDIRKYLGKIPKDLKEAYNEIYSRILEQSDTRKEIAERTFQWIACSSRPLKPDELIAAVCQDPSTDEVDPIDEGITIEFILGACHNLLVVDPHSNTCRFSHLSVQEYIEESHWNQSQSNGLVAKVSLSLLINSNYWNDEEERFPDGIDAIVPYVETSWFHHVQKHGEEEIDPRLTTLLKRFLGSMNEASLAYTSWCMRDPDRYAHIMPGSRSSLAIVSFGLFKVLSDWWDTGFDNVNERNSRGATLLTLAAKEGCLSVATALIEKGADLNARSEDFGRPLRAAALGGVKAIVELMLDAGADTNAFGGNYGSALRAAVVGQNKEIVKLMLDRGADVTAANDEYGSALALAAWRKEKETVKLLLDGGTDANAPAGHFGNSLEAAAAGGDREIVELLLERGADVNLTGGKYGCPLGGAVFRKNRGIVELLLDRGADVNTLGGYYGSPLGVAAGVKDKDTAELLLSKGADVNAPGDHFSGALEAAAVADGMDTVNLLLDRGADVNAKGGKYDSPLAATAAAWFGSKEMVEILLDRGANIEGAGGNFSPLSLASKKGAKKASGPISRARNRGAKDIIDILVERGAKPPIDDSVS